jgi:hypothetical protein
MKSSKNTSAVIQEGTVLPIRCHPLLSALAKADIRDVETMEAFFVEHGSSRKRGTLDRQRLYHLVVQLQALIQGRALPISPAIGLTKAEWLTLSSPERVLLASLTYLSSSIGRGVDECFVSEWSDKCKFEGYSISQCKPAPFAR